MAAAAVIGLAASASAQTEKPQGVLYRAPSGVTLRLMIDETNLGAEASVGELTFPANSDSGDHAHGAIEMFYVVSRRARARGQRQEPDPQAGMTGYVKPPDQVRHKTGPAGAKVVVIWVPGEEGRRVASRWKREP